MLKWLANIVKGISAKPHSAQLPKPPTKDIAVSPPGASRHKKTAVWMPPGVSISIGDFNIPGGMIYVGTHFPLSNDYSQTDPCLINPQLQVDKFRPDYQGEEIGYWPSYTDITPGSRAAYLEWLMGDRKAPNVCIGYIFLFFYGLERRVLIDLKSQSTDNSTELRQIISEVERLLELYSVSSSFLGYATRFLEVCKLMLSPETLLNETPSFGKTSLQIPLGTQIALGWMALEGKPVPLEWLFSWYLHSDNARLRTPATRCKQEFQKLLRLKYQAKYDQGMVLKPSKPLLRAEYRPASSGFSHSPLEIDIGDVPDVTGYKEPLKKIQLLIDECTDALDPYSRWLGRNPNDHNEKAAIALLPAELVENSDSDEAYSLRQWLKETLGDAQQKSISGRQLISSWTEVDANKLTKQETTILSQVLEKLGYGIEPDVRFGGKAIEKNSQVVLFRAAGETIGTLSKAYSAAKTLLRLAVAIAQADNVVDVSEQSHLEEHLERGLDLSCSERTRLKAYLAWLLKEKISFQGIKTKLSKMTLEEKSEIPDFLISVAGADGHISPKEISMLSKIYPILGFEADEVYSHLCHFNASPSVTSKSMEALATGPVIVRTATADNKGFSIPSPPVDKDSIDETSSGFELDILAVQKKQDESARVSALLEEIFDDEISSIEEKNDDKPSEENEVSSIGLDSVHTKFLSVLGQKKSWSRDSLESEVAKLGLLLDGALEVINDSAFELSEEALTNGDDPIEVDTDILRQLLA